MPEIKENVNVVPLSQAEFARLPKGYTGEAGLVGMKHGLNISLHSAGVHFNYDKEMFDAQFSEGMVEILSVKLVEFMKKLGFQLSAPTAEKITLFTMGYSVGQNGDINQMVITMNPSFFSPEETAEFVGIVMEALSEEKYDANHFQKNIEKKLREKEGNNV